MTKRNIMKNCIGLILIFLILMLIFSTYKIVTWFLDNKENQKRQDEISKYIEIEKVDDNQEKYNIDFNNLKNINEDVCGWIKVNNTNIEYTVVQGENNEYYLKHNFEKKKNSAGWIFADYNNKLDGTDKNIVIYGHNMKNGSMFGTLNNILTRDWQTNNENRYISFITENEESIYEVFSVYKIVSEEYYNKTNFSDKEFIKFVETLKSRSLYNFNVDVNEDDNILTLSTCASNSQYRVVLHAKKCQRGRGNLAILKDVLLLAIICIIIFSFSNNIYTIL